MGSDAGACGSLRYPDSDHKMKTHPLTLKSNGKSVGTFFVMLLPKSLFGSEYREPHLVHEAVIRPILEIAEECRVYKANGLPAELFDGICVRKTNGVFCLDLEKELLIGREYLWNASDSVRGTIVIVVPKLNDELTGAFDIGRKPLAWATSYQLTKGHTPSAVRYAIRKAESGNTAVLFSSSNGIAEIDVIATEPQLSRLMREAEERGADEDEFTWRK